MLLQYIPNFYSNGGTRTHVIILHESLGSELIRFELHKATDVLKVVKPVLTGVQISSLKTYMKYRERLFINEQGKNPYPKD